MAGLNTLEASNVVLPKDLVITAQPNIDTNFFTVTAKGLAVDSSYNFQFQWVYADGTLGPWSPSVFLFTPTESVPGAPTVSVPSTSTAYIPVTLSTFPANALRVDVKITGGDFGIGKVAHSFLGAGTTTIPAAAGVYYVELYTITPTGISGTPTSAFTITVSDVGEVIQSPTNPSGFSSKRILAGIEVSWAGTYANSTFTGFEAINIYAGNSATATVGTYEQVGVLTGNNVKNTIVIPLGTYVVYGQSVYIHAAAVNKSGAVGTIQANVTNQLLGPGKATDADINDGAVVISKLASDVLTVGNLKAGDINATSFIRAGTAGSARVEISSSTVGSVLPGLTVYNSSNQQILRAPLTGGLTINGNGTFTGSITGASGQFDGDLGASGGNFTVRSGIVTALAGNIGGWTISSSQITSNGSDYISLIPGTPRISIVKASSPNAGSITLDPIEGIKSGTTFQVTPAGSLTATDAIFTGGKITVSGGVGNAVQIGKNVEGTNHGIYINANNYWYGTGLFSVGNATNNVVWNNTKLTVTGEINATSGYIGTPTAGFTVGAISGSATLYGIRSSDGSIELQADSGTSRIKIGNNYMLTGQTGTSSAGLFILTEFTGGYFRDILTTNGVDSGDGGKIYLGDNILGVGGRAVYVKKSAQIAGGTENANSGGLRNMFTGTTTLFNTIGAANIYSGAVNGDVLLVYNPG